MKSFQFEEVMDPIIDHVGDDLKRPLRQAIKAASEAMNDDFYQGRINLIAVPRYLLENEDTCFVYRSHPLGLECKCFPTDHGTFISYLKQHQEGKATSCNAQYRMLTYPLNEYADVRTFTFDNFNQSTNEVYASHLKRIHELASVALLHS